MSQQQVPGKGISREIGKFTLYIMPMSQTDQCELLSEVVGTLGPAWLEACSRRESQVSSKAIGDAVVASNILPVLNQERRIEQDYAELRERQGMGKVEVPSEAVSMPQSSPPHMLDMFDATHAGLVALMQGGRAAWRDKILPLVHFALGVGRQQASVLVTNNTVPGVPMQVWITTANDVNVAFSGGSGADLILATAQVLEVNLSDFFSPRFTRALAEMMEKIVKS